MKAIKNARGRFFGAALAVIASFALSAPARADVTVNPGSINFASQDIGVISRLVSVTITNSGSTRMTIARARVSPAQFSYRGPSRRFTLRPRQSVRVAFTFRPTAAQEFNGTFTLVQADGKRVHIPLAGTGAGARRRSDRWSRSKPTMKVDPATVSLLPEAKQTFTATVSGRNDDGVTWSVTCGSITSGGLRGFYTAPAAPGSCTVTGRLKSDPGVRVEAAVTVTGAADEAAVAPSITSQPANRAVTAGQAAAFAVSAAGTAPLSYQWKKNGANIAGATSSGYTTPSTTTADNGAQFTVVVSNSAGSATSNAAALTVNSAAAAPSITSQPANRTVTAGQTAAFTVSAAGTAPLSYQWKKNGANIAGATSSGYTTPSTTTADNGAQFTVVVSNSSGSATSNAAALTVSASTLLLSVNPASLSFGNVNVGSSSTQSVTFTNSGNAGVTISNVAHSGAGFSVSGLASGQILSPGQAGTLSVTFTPSASGSFNGSITVTSNSSNSPGSVSLSGSGVQLVPHRALLTWTPSTSSVVGYQVYTSAVAGGPYTKLTASLVTTPSYTDSAVQSGKAYYYVVTGVSATDSESAYSNEVAALIP